MRLTHSTLQTKFEPFSKKRDFVQKNSMKVQRLKSVSLKARLLSIWPWKPGLGQTDDNINTFRKCRSWHSIIKQNVKEIKTAQLERTCRLKELKVYLFIIEYCFFTQTNFYTVHVKHKLLAFKVINTNVHNMTMRSLEAYSVISVVSSYMDSIISMDSRFNTQYIHLISDIISLIHYNLE